MKKLVHLFLLFFLINSSIQSYSQNTVIHEIPWYSDTVGMWGPSSIPWNINKIDTLLNFSVGPFANSYSYVIHLPWSNTDSVGAILDYGVYLNMQMIFEMTGWSNGAVKVNYPTKIQMDFPADNTFSTGDWVTVQSDYRAQDASTYSEDNDVWDISANFPDAGKIELYLNFNAHAHADMFFSDPSDLFNISWDTLSFMPPIDVNMNNYDLFLIDVQNGQYVIPWVDYHTDPLFGNLIIDSIYLKSGSWGSAISFPPVFYDLIGLAGNISLPDIASYSKSIKNGKQLYALGQDDYLHIYLDIVKFIQQTTHYLSFMPGLQGLDAVYQAMQYESGANSIYLFTDPLSSEDFTVDFSWDLIEANLLFTNVMNQTLSFVDTKEYSSSGTQIPPSHSTNVWNIFEFPIQIEYRVLDTLGNIVEQGTSNNIKFSADNDIQLRMPICSSFDSIPVKITHAIDPWLTNVVQDTTKADFFLKVLDIWYKLGTASNPLLTGSYVLYQDTFSFSFANPQLFGPPSCMPWQINGNFQDTTFANDEYLVPANQALHYNIITTVPDSINAGSAQVIVTGGVLPYTYIWSNGTTIISTSDIADNLNGGTYYVTITDANGCAVTDYVVITSNLSCGPPDNITNTYLSSSSVTISWDAVIDANAYNIQYRKVGAAYWMSHPSTVSTTTTISPLASASTYEYQIQTVCASGFSIWSLPYQFTTDNANCATPHGLKVTNVASTSVTLGWNAVTGALYYNVQYKKSSESGSNAWTSVMSYTNSKEISNLDMTTSYDFKVQTACSSTSFSTYSYNYSFMTTGEGNSCTDSFEPNNSTSNAPVINVNTSINALISSATDIDLYKFSNTAAQKNIKILLSNLPYDYDVYLYNSSGNIIPSTVQSGITNEVIIYNNAPVGIYYIRVSGYNGVYSASSCYLLTANVSNSTYKIAGMSENSNEETNFSLFPNPAKQQATINYNCKEGNPVHIKVIDITGRIVSFNDFNASEGTNSFNLDLNNINNGLYFVELTNGKEIMVNKLVIDR